MSKNTKYIKSGFFQVGTADEKLALNLTKTILEVMNENGYPTVDSCCTPSPIPTTGQTLVYNGTKWVATTVINPVSKGTAVLVGGTKIVSNTNVTSTSNIQLTSNVDGGTPGFVRITSKTTGVGFTITSSSNTDTSTIAYVIF